MQPPHLMHDSKGGVLKKNTVERTFRGPEAGREETDQTDGVDATVKLAQVIFRQVIFYKNSIMEIKMDSIAF